MNKKKLKIGILLNSYHVPLWFFRSIERIVNSENVELSVVVLFDNNACQSKITKIWKRKNTIVFHILKAIESIVFRRKTDAKIIKNIADILPTEKINELFFTFDKDSEALKQSDVNEIKKHNLDILITTGQTPLNSQLLTVAKYGIWGYQLSDYQIDDEQIAGFWESIEKHSQTGSSLFMVGPDGKRKRLARTSSLTDFLSPSRNTNQICWNSLPLLPRQIQRLSEIGEDAYFKEVEQHNSNIEFYSGPLYKIPSNLKSTYLLGKYLLRIILMFSQKIFFKQQWYLMFDLKSTLSTSVKTFKTIMSNKDRFWADPHIINTDNNYYIFVEEYLYKKKLGHLSVIEMDGYGTCKEPVRILEKNYHLSYPYVFKVDDEYYMIPETKGNQTIQLYQCIDFPDKWQFKMNLMENVKAVDATVFYHNQKWWLFVCIAENEGASTYHELFLFYANELMTTDWGPHPLNPIVCDIKNARPAGKIFIHEGTIYRPAQDCSERYGRCININEILQLSETEYLEKKVDSITPDWDKRVLATHTLANEGYLTMIDALQFRRRFF